MANRREDGTSSSGIGGPRGEGRSVPRILVLVGSGETAPTLARVHRDVVGRLGGLPLAACLIDTPYGFQENADDLSARTREYFRDSVGLPMEIATFRSAEAGPVAEDVAVAAIRRSSLVFSGPGSPSYALRQWVPTAIPRVLAEKMASGGAVIFASAAALTLGRVTIPVYEIYKVGEEPHWLDGLDMLSPLGLPVAVIPHYDNAEGGNHDTRFCYLGERRLEAMERQLPDDVFVLGIDGHTALILDLDRHEATVAGVGTVTVRVGGRSRSWASGTAMPIDALALAADDLRRRPSAEERTAVARPNGANGRRPPGGDPARSEPAPSAMLPEAVASIERGFDAALADGDVEDAVGAILRLERTITEWSRDPGRSEEFEHARVVLRSLVVRLGEVAVVGTRDPRDLVGPFVDTLLDLRRRAREAGDWQTADAIRERLVEAGVEVRDVAGATEWLLGEAPVAEAARHPS